jgi:hypothetical protein
MTSTMIAVLVLRPWPMPLRWEAPPGDLPVYSRSKGLFRRCQRWYIQTDLTSLPTDVTPPLHRGMMASLPTLACSRARLSFLSHPTHSSPTAVTGSPSVLPHRASSPAEGPLKISTNRMIDLIRRCMGGPMSIPRRRVYGIRGFMII